MIARLLLLGAFALPQSPADPAAPARAAVAAAEAAHGADSLEVAQQLLKLGTLQLQRGDAAAAEASFARVLAIREAKLPAGHQQIAVARVNLAAAFAGQHRPEAARPHLERVRAELAGGAPSRVQIGVLVNLGISETLLGNFTAAGGLFEEAVAYTQKHYPDHTYLAFALQNLAQIRLIAGDIEAARQLVVETIAVLERTDPGGARHAHALHGLGVALAHSGRHAEARDLLTRSLQMREQLLGEHQDLGPTLHWLAWLARREGDLPGARAHLERAVAIGHLAGPRWTTAIQHASLGRVLGMLGDRPGAAEQARAARELAGQLGLTPQQTGELAFGEAELHELAGDLAAAAAAWQRATGAAGDGSRDQLEARSHLARIQHRRGEHGPCVATLRDNLAAFARLLPRTLPALFETERLAYVRQQRGDLDLLLACSAVDPAAGPAATVWAEVLAWKGQVARGMQQQLAAARRHPDDRLRLRRLQQIAGEVAMGHADAGMLAERERLRAALSDETGSPAPPATPAAIAAALAVDEALVDCVQYEGSDHAQRIAAFVVRRGGVTRVELGDERTLAPVIERHRLVTSRSTRPGAGALAQEAAAAARRAVFAPLQAAVQGCTKLTIGPDGVLATLPFESLPGDADGTFLVEQFEFCYLQNAAQSLHRPPADERALLVAFGAIDFGDPDGAPAELRGFPRPFPPLPHAEQELRAITAAAGGRPTLFVRGGQATEARLREACVGASWLHLATHGFYGGHRDGGALDAGIALASANRPGAEGDGVLTADEAALLDLSHCRLVVLSACQSGLGEPFAGESLLGLRRSLHVAGAGATVTSLWLVGDQATAELMADFYRALFGDDQPPAAALRAAQLAALARARQTTGEGLPGRWAAFVCEGR